MCRGDYTHDAHVDAQDFGRTPEHACMLFFWAGVGGGDRRWRGDGDGRRRWGREETGGDGRRGGGGRGRAGAPEIFHVGANTELHLTGGGDGTIRDIVQTQWTSSPSSSSRLGTVCVHWVPRARAHTNLPAHTRYSRKHPIVPSVRTRARAPHPDPASSSTSASSRLVRVCVHCTRERARAPTSPPRTHTAFEETPECIPPPRARSRPRTAQTTLRTQAAHGHLRSDRYKKRAENGGQNATHCFLCFFLQSFFSLFCLRSFFYFPPAPAFYSFASQFTRIHCETAASHQDQDRTSDPLVPG